MSNNANSRRKVEMPGSIRSKFVAALCMLLVSAIMLISSTYAWFTLSTAPEVKGITTQVGANGNLEMALLNSDSYGSTADDLGIKSEIGDSMTVQDIVKSNIKWGNLVDLGHASYGLGNILLMPSKLNVTTVGEGDAAANFVNSSSLLLAPSYGSDGRVIDVKEATYTANYNAAGGNFKYNSKATSAGVRAIGTSSDVSVRFSSYRSALSAAQTATSNAVMAAQRSLSSNAQDIAALLVRKGASDATEFHVKYLDTIDSILTGVETANGYLEDAIIQYVLAYRLSKNGDTLTTDADVEALVGAATTIGWATTWAGTATSKPAGLDDAIAAYNKIASDVSYGKTKLAGIRTALNGVDTSANSYLLTWGDGGAYDIGPVFDTLVNRNGASVAGVPATAPKAELIQAAFNSFTATSTIPVVLGEGSGVYYDIASACGNYTVPTTINGDDLGYDPLKGLPINATITASTGSNPSSLSVVRGEFTSDTAPDSSVASGSDMIISDTYGYALDFGFRTNAANSNLLLQTAAAQRVYTESVSSTTQGLGSNLKFTTNDIATFTLNDVRGLMSAVRIAFVTPGSENGNELLAMAKLDITATNNPDGTVTYSGGTEDGNAVSADLYLCNYTVGADGVVKVGDKKAGDGASVITDLAQNKAKKITVIVYLDGEEVDNTMVANAEKSVTGNLNLQFSSSATLVPMVNSSLMATVDKSQLDPYTVPAEVMNALKQQYPGLAGANVTFWQTKTTPKAYYYSLDGGTTLSPITLPTTP